MDREAQSLVDWQACRLRGTGDSRREACWQARGHDVRLRAARAQRLATCFIAVSQIEREDEQRGEVGEMRWLVPSELQAVFLTLFSS